MTGGTNRTALIYGTSSLYAHLIKSVKIDRPLSTTHPLARVAIVSSFSQFDERYARPGEMSSLYDYLPVQIS